MFERQAPYNWIRDWRRLELTEPPELERGPCPSDTDRRRLRTHLRLRRARAIEGPAMIGTFGACFVMVGVAVGGFGLVRPQGGVSDYVTGISLVMLGGLTLALFGWLARYRLRRDPVARYLRTPTEFVLEPARFARARIEADQQENRGKSTHMWVRLDWDFGRSRRLSERTAYSLTSSRARLAGFGGSDSGWVARREGGSRESVAEDAFLWGVSRAWLADYAPRRKWERRTELLLFMLGLMILGFAFFWIIAPAIFPLGPGA